MWMSEASWMYGRPTCGATPSVISSPASAAGASLYDRRVGPIIERYGLAPVLASLSPARAKETGLLTRVTSGLTGATSSRSRALQSSLESRLRRQLSRAGSTLFSLTWRVKATPAGRPYCQLAASARRTSDSGFGSWPTPAAQEPGGTLEMHNARRRKAIAKGVSIGATSQGAMSHAAQLASWPTPMAGTPQQNGNNEAGNNDSSRKTVALVPWTTPSATDGERSGVQTNQMTGSSMPQMARLAWLASGPTPSGSPAQTEKPGQLDPDHSRWVMGYSAEHLSCAPMAMQLSPKRPKRSSGR